MRMFSLFRWQVANLVFSMAIDRRSRDEEFDKRKASVGLVVRISLKEPRVRSRLRYLVGSSVSGVHSCALSSLLHTHRDDHTFTVVEHSRRRDDDDDRENGRHILDVDSVYSI